MIEQAYALAKATLKDRYTPLGIYAGKSHFSDVWLRDSCYAALGSLNMGDWDIVKTNLTTIFKFMNDQGQAPLRVGQKNMLLKFMGFHAKIPQARYIEDKGISTPTDGNSLFIWSVFRYLNATRDTAFVEAHFDLLEKAVEWNFTQDKNGDLLIEEGPYAGWADSLKKTGTVLYTNVLHYKAMVSFSEICETLNRVELATHYRRSAKEIQKRIHQSFWNGRYFSDWIDASGKVHDYFSTDGNMWAIVFGVATLEQAWAIQKTTQELGLDRGFSTHSNHPSYAPSVIYPLFFLLNMHDYHNGLEWLWLGCVDAVAKHLIGQEEEGRALLTRIAEKIMEYNGVYEVYYNGAPVKRFWYKSEQWFAWSSGLFVWACHELGMVGEG